MDDVRVLIARLVCASGVAAFVFGGFGGGWPASGLEAGHVRAPAASQLRPAASSRPPTPADFVGYPSCMLYASGADLRVRVRAPRAVAVCRRLSRQLSRLGFRWSLHGRRPRRIVSPICRFADPRGEIELEVIDDAANSERGERICASLARTGWFDLAASKRTLLSRVGWRRR